MGTFVLGPYFQQPTRTSRVIQSALCRLLLLPQITGAHLMRLSLPQNCLGQENCNPATSEDLTWAIQLLGKSLTLDCTTAPRIIITLMTQHFHFHSQTYKLNLASLLNLSTLINQQHIFQFRKKKTNFLLLITQSFSEKK